MIAWPADQRQLVAIKHQIQRGIRDRLVPATCRKQPMDESDTWQQHLKSPVKRARVCLKTINIKIEDEYDEEENDETVLLEIDEIDGPEGSVRTVRMDIDDEEDWYSRKRDPANANHHYKDCAIIDGTRVELPPLQRNPKRIIWGEEMPCNPHSLSLDSSQINYALSSGMNPFITIRSYGGKTGTTKEDIIISSATAGQILSSSRVLDLDKLRNYFLLTKLDTEEPSKCEHKFYLSLLDSSMPRLTNCSSYYRMRYAVYVLPKPRASRYSSVVHSSSAVNWRRRRSPVPSLSPPVQQEEGENGKQKGPLLHIGEMHLYTTFPKDGKAMVVDADQRVVSTSKDLIHYENLSFFLNQSPLSWEEKAALKMWESDINQMTLAFRHFLKHTNGIIVNVSRAGTATPQQANYNSTYLLEQLKYPKSLEDFTNPDRMCEQFVRNQADMFARYDALFRTIQSSELNSSSEQQGPTKSTTPSPTGKQFTELLNGDSFGASLHRLKNQADLKSEI